MDTGLATNGMVGRVETTCWIAPPSLTHEQWTQIGNTFQQIRDSLSWWIGDWLNVGETRYGETYSNAIKYTDKTLEQLKQYKWVAGAIAPERRKEELTFTHHRYVAHLPPADQDYWLQRCVNEELGTADLWKLLKEPDKDSVTSGRLPATASPDQAYQWMVDTFDDNWWQRFIELVAA